MANLLTRASGRRSALACFILVARTPDPAARTRRFDFIIARGGSDRGWDHVERDSLLVPAITARRGTWAAVTGWAGRPVIARNPLGAVRSLIAGAALVAVLALRALGPIGCLGPFVVTRAALLMLHGWTIVVARLHHLVVLIFVAIVLAALPALLVEARPAFAQHTIIMIGVLEVIFGLDAVAGELRIARHALVFFQELGGVAALAIVLAIAVRPAGNVARRLSSTSAAAVALLSIDQILILMPQAPARGGP